MPAILSLSKDPDRAQTQGKPAAHTAGATPPAVGRARAQARGPSLPGRR